MLRKFADILAIIFHPVFMGTSVLLAFAFKRGELPQSSLPFAAGMILLFTLVIPVAATYFLHKDIHLKNRKQRFLPLLVTLASHLALFYFLWPGYSGTLLHVGIILLTINVVVLLVFTAFIKASMHANAIVIVLCLFALAYGIISSTEPVPPLFYIILIPLSILFGLVIWQRIVSKAHTKSEIIAGGISGLVSIFLLIILFYIDGLLD